MPTSSRVRTGALLGLLVLALPLPSLAQDPKVSALLCDEAKSQLDKDPSMKAAVSAAFQAPLHFGSRETPDDDGAAPGCDQPEALLNFADADALIVSTSSSGPPIHTQTVSMSAYVLKKVGGDYRLMMARADFAQGNSGWGNVDDIIPARFGKYNGIVLSGGATGQGYYLGVASFHVIRDNGIFTLGALPMQWSNQGAANDVGNAIAIDGKYQIDRRRSDNIAVTYVRKAVGGSQMYETLWTSENGKFRLVSGTLPEEIARDFN
ncbi:hypothetical protein [Labrys neptuniae]